MYYATVCQSPVGALTLACDEVNLVGLWMEGQKYRGGALPAAMTAEDNFPLLKAAKKWLGSYFAGQRPSPCELPLAPAGSAFRQEVWDILRAIPYGEVVTYGYIAGLMAAKTGKARMSAQAVGGAVGHNPISIIIPCHRVVGANGSLTGYGGGIKTKVRLLALEGVDMTRLFVPQKGTAL